MASADVALSAIPYSADPSARDPVAAHAGDVAGAPNDEFDDILNYDAQIDNVFQDVDGNIQRSTTTGGKGGLPQDVDEEVKVRKKRAPIAKLDEERLLGPNGIPKLRRITKERLKFKGKGHEFTDVSRLLNLYQMWLDDMFPKAKFADGLSIIEKLGHKRRMQIMRQEWIAEERPKPAADYDMQDTSREHEDELFIPEDIATAEEPNDEATGNRRENEAQVDPPARSEQNEMEGPHTSGEQRQKVTQDDIPGLDELDILLGGDSNQQSDSKSPPREMSKVQEADDFADDEEAMRGIW